MAHARILLADDHKEMRDRVVCLLEREFEMLEPVKNGQELLEAAARLKPDLCLLDISMPVVNGIEAAARLKDSGSKAKIIFLTIHEDTDFLAAALRAGASGYVVKPRMASDLRAAIKEVLAGRTYISPSLSSIKKNLLTHEHTRESVNSSPVNRLSYEVD